MKYLQNKNKNKNKTIYLLGGVILISILFLWRTIIGDVASDVIFKFSVPLLKIENYLSDSMATAMITFNNKEDLIKQNTELVHRINLGKTYELENRLLREENIILKKLLGRNTEEKNSFFQKSEKKLFLGYVLGGPVDPPYDSLIIDTKGEDISIGSLVLNEEGFVMGEIIEKYSNSSKIQMFSSYGNKTDIFLGENKTMVTLNGIGSGNFFVSLPQDFLIEKGDYAIYPGEKIKIIAFVDSVEYKEGDMFKKVFLKSPFNIKNIRIVGILNEIK